MKLKKGQKTKNLVLFSLYALLLGFAVGIVVWTILKIMDLGIELIWKWIPAMAGGQTPLYTLCVCLVGGLILGLFQRKYGVLPDTLEQVMGRVKTEGKYPYNNLHIIIIAALLPLVFGASIGPEAGLTGVIVGLCCWVGDHLKDKGIEARELAKAGMAATLTVIFNAPLFGFMNNLEEPREVEKRFLSAKELKAAKICVYLAAIIGGLGGIAVLGKFFGGSMGFARFPTGTHGQISDWKWIIVFIGAGILCGVFFSLTSKLSEFIARPLVNNRIALCLTGGVILAVTGTLLP